MNHNSSAQKSNFLEIAKPLIERGIKVIPVEPFSKRGVLKDQFKFATTRLEQIRQWNTENPDYNVGCVGSPDGIVILDCDVKGLIKSIEQETGHKLPVTLIVRSAGKGCAHVYFHQTDISRNLGNKKRAGLFDLQSVDRYVVGPGSRLENGRKYEIVQDAPIADFPEWLAAWIASSADADKPKAERKDDRPNDRPVDDSFDIGDFLEHYDIGYHQDGEWYITDVCPVAGRKHKQSTRTGFYFDGNRFGFHCFATGCDGSSMTVGQVIQFLNQDYEPFPDAIWQEESIEDVLEEMGIEEADLADEEVDVAGEEEVAASPAVEPPRQTRCASAVPQPAPSQPAACEPKGPLAFPEEFMYGEAKALAQQMKMPYGLAYMALVGEFGIKCDIDVMCGTRINTYTVLIANVGGGKNVAMDRAKTLLELRYMDEYLPASPAGTRALMNLIGDKAGKAGKRGEGNERVPGPGKLLLITHEMTDVLKMTGVENSTLASRLSDFWDDNQHVYPTGKDGIINVNCRLHWIGGVPASASNPTRFIELFDSETSHGLYDRLLIGYAEEKFNYKPWEPPTKKSKKMAEKSLPQVGKKIVPFTDDWEPEPEPQTATEVAEWGDDYDFDSVIASFVKAISEGAQQLLDDWEPVGGGSRVKQNCMKVALITTMMNQEEIVTEECMKCAIGIMEWQIELRKVFQPGEAVNDEAKCRVAILSSLEAAGAKHRYVNLKRMAHDRKWGNRFGDRIVKTAISNLADMGEIVPKVVDTSSGKTKSKSEFKLRDWSLGGGKSGENGEHGESPSTDSGE